LLLLLLAWRHMKIVGSLGCFGGPERIRSPLSPACQVAL